MLHGYSNHEWKYAARHLKEGKQKSEIPKDNEIPLFSSKEAREIFEENVPAYSEEMLRYLLFTATLYWIQHIFIS
jgi:hypothetical protein